MRILLPALIVAVILSVAPKVAAAGTLETPLYFSPLTDEGGTELQVPREAFAGVPLDGEVLIAGGHQGNTILSTAEMFNSNDDTFSPLSKGLNAARSNIAATTVIGPGFQEVLLAGGWNGGAMNSAELFDPLTGTFKTVPNQLQTVRADAVAAPLPGGGALIAGGYDGNSDLQSAELYEPFNDTFTTLPHQLQTPRADAVAAALPDGEVLIAGGNNESSGGLQSAELFNPTDETFTPLQGSGDHELQIAREYATAASLPDGEILIAGGYNENDGQLQSAEIFDPNNDTFTALPASGTTEQQAPRAGAIAAPLPNGLVLIAGGFDGSTLQSAELVYPGPEVTGGDFGDQTVGEPSADQSLIVTNLGTQSLEISAASLGGADTGDFSILADECTSITLPARESCTITTRFTPSATGPREATITLSDNQPVATEITLSGAGVAANSGPTGPTGPAGPTGTTGSTGPIGLTGSIGPAGLTGATGSNGTNGTSGSNGTQGPSGAQGPPGAQGELLTCKAASTGKGRHKKTIQRCTTKPMSPPISSTTAGPAVAAVLSRGETLYATGFTLGAGKQTKLLLLPRRNIGRGAYTLTLTRGHKREPQTITID